MSDTLTRPQALDYYNDLRAAYDHQPKAELASGEVRIWVDALMSAPAPVIDRAFRRMLTRDSTYWPTLGELNSAIAAERRAADNHNPPLPAEPLEDDPVGERFAARGRQHVRQLSEWLATRPAVDRDDPAWHAWLDRRPGQGELL